MEKKAGADAIDTSIPWGVYVPPSPVQNINTNKSNNGDDDSVQQLPIEQHGGYVRIVDSKGKSFPCGFSRPIGFVMETVMSAKKKRSRLDISDTMMCNTTNNEIECDDNKLQSSTTVTEETKAVKHQKKTITEERLHPEEALFLHLRGLLRIESSSNTTTTNGEELKTKSDISTTNSTRRILSTQYLFCNMLSECNIPLAAYLAYAHLRGQGYILIRYTEQKIKLLCEMMEECKKKVQLPRKMTNHATQILHGKIQMNDKAITVGDCSEVVDSSSQCNSMFAQQTPNNDDKVEICMKSTSKIRYETRPFRMKLSDDIATAPPPWVVSLVKDVSNTTTATTLEKKKEDDIPKKKKELRLAYYAYNPNSQFKRTNPGLPDFGVAIMPYHSDACTDEPTFDTLNSLVSMCECSGNDVSLPLRVVTVADGGAVIAFGITHGDVPTIVDQSKASI